MEKDGKSMNEKARKYVDMFREVKVASAATVDKERHPHSRIINIMIAADEGMYIVTSKGKPFYEQLIQSGEIALSAMCPDCQSLKFTGKVKLADKAWLPKVFEDNPGMNEVYPRDTRNILDVFLIYEGCGEWFDLLHHPVSRESFAYGREVEKAGFFIEETCIGCGSCTYVCPQNCITVGSPYRINPVHCLHCGACMETCPADAVKKLHR